MNKTPQRHRAPRNRTIEVTSAEAEYFRTRLSFDFEPNRADQIICGDAFVILNGLSGNKFNLLFADPPYNQNRSFGGSKFRRVSSDEYAIWLDTWLRSCLPLLKSTASVYLCGDWRSSGAIERAGTKYFKLRNRITWEREKGRGARRNWKNAAEDIWFFTLSDEYTFNIHAVKQRRRVIAPYTENGKPKDWESSVDGNYRTTHPSNIWTDISVPFWSMPENTDHPTQKPEKLLAKIILASTNDGDLILDPFAGVGTTAVVAKKLGRHFVAIERDEDFCLLALKRLEMAKTNRSIQGLSDGVFWERNSGR